ncbi:hypothetical protein [Chryseolinea lacunae]|uniref:Uncharacterized protein n=1 Tax=Chryseolinea lacunae TaxID=2801331 RepID=A0ABS1KPZ2_9BACT|nr:hypothetical protein [Chryseolinea lacunae]MBL0741424.1 hypothetical protein [Chryseolinea lacunae]
MPSKNLRYPLVRLSEDTQSTLFLIREELKSRKLFHALHKVDFDDCYFLPHLDSLILKELGLDDLSDDEFAIYSEILERRGKKIEADNDAVMKQTLRAYYELVEAKKKMKAERRP